MQLIIHRASSRILKDTRYHMLEMETSAISKTFSRQHIINKSIL